MPMEISLLCLLTRAIYTRFERGTKDNGNDGLHPNVKRQIIFKLPGK